MPTLREQRDTAMKNAEALIEKTRQGVELSEAESASLKSAVDAVKALSEQMRAADEAEKLLKSLPASGQTGQRGEAGTLGEHFLSHAGQKALSGLKARRRGIQVDAPEFSGVKAPGDLVTTAHATSGTDLIRPDLDKRIVKEHLQRPTIASWLGAGTITSNSITYFVEKSWDKAQHGSFETVAEGAKKPGLTPPGYEQVTETLKKIAGYIKVSEEMADDAEFLVSEINNRLLYQLLMFEEQQLLNGEGAGTDIKGLLKRTGVQTGTVSSAGLLDYIDQAVVSIQTSTGLQADGIVMHPADYQAIRMRKDGNGQYLAGGPFIGQYGKGSILPSPPIWGLPVIATTAIGRGELIIGAGKAAATVYRKGGLRVEASNVDGEDFTHNRFTILAEERLTLAVRYPAAFMHVKVQSEPAGKPAGK